jgi:hypothetical protein
MEGAVGIEFCAPKAGALPGCATPRLNNYCTTNDLETLFTSSAPNTDSLWPLFWFSPPLMARLAKPSGKRRKAPLKISQIPVKR